MRLKTYIVDTVTEAMPLIKKDLGDDALILNTKKVKTGGFLGFFQKEKLEVIAVAEKKQPDKVKQNEEVLLKKNNAVLETETVDRKDHIVHKTQNSAEIPSSELVQEIRSLKQFMVQVMEEDRLPEVLKPIQQKLEEQQLSSDIRSEVISHLLFVLKNNPEITQEELKAATRNRMIQLVNEKQKPFTNQNPKIICFIGPTGVGKTTSIAKIAADYILNFDKKVGLITSDTYRIAAVEQLMTYAKILNIPMKVAETANELANVIEELKDCDMILMDTAGRNYQQQEYIEHLKQLLVNKDEIQINLVLSLTAKYEDMKKIINNFKSFKVDQLLLTKQDETSSYGAIVNLIHDYSYPVRYITNGQNVPNDILPVTSELIVDFILGEDVS